MRYLILMILLNHTNTINKYYNKTKYIINVDNIPTKELLYDNVWGTIYHAEKKQCDNTPTITGDGSKIDPNNASSHRWIAICHEMLNDKYRRSLINDPECDRFKGKIKYGDTVWIESENPQLNGWWVVHDAKHKRVKNSVDFLQTKGDGTLYNNNKLWSGRFNDLKIYKYNIFFKKQFN